MTTSYWVYLRDIFINPVRAANAIPHEKHLKWVAIFSFLVGSIPYFVIVITSYHVLGWGDFPYKQYYPYYFSPYWWEVFVVPIWGLVIALGFGVSCYYGGKLFGGTGTFSQIISFVLLASVVSLPIMVIADVLRINYRPDLIIDFAKYGEWSASFDSYSNKVIWFVEASYFYFAMAWQGIVTIIGLAIIHKIRWFKNIPGLVLGNAIFFGFLLLIKDYVALII